MAIEICWTCDCCGWELELQRPLYPDEDLFGESGDRCAECVDHQVPCSAYTPTLW